MPVCGHHAERQVQGGVAGVGDLVVTYALEMCHSPIKCKVVRIPCYNTSSQETLASQLAVLHSTLLAWVAFSSEATEMVSGVTATSLGTTREPDVVSYLGWRDRRNKLSSSSASSPAQPLNQILEEISEPRQAKMY